MKLMSAWFVMIGWKEKRKFGAVETALPFFIYRASKSGLINQPIQNLKMVGAVQVARNLNLISPQIIFAFVVEQKIQNGIHIQHLTVVVQFARSSGLALLVPTHVYCHAIQVHALPANFKFQMGIAIAEKHPTHWDVANLIKGSHVIKFVANFYHAESIAVIKFATPENVFLVKWNLGEIAIVAKLKIRR